MIVVILVVFLYPVVPLGSCAVRRLSHVEIHLARVLLEHQCFMLEDGFRKQIRSEMCSSMGGLSLMLLCACFG